MAGKKMDAVRKRMARKDNYDATLEEVQQDIADRDWEDYVDVVGTPKKNRQPKTAEMLRQDIVVRFARTPTEKQGNETRKRLKKLYGAK